MAPALPPLTESQLPPETVDGVAMTTRVVSLIVNT
jgi:hypothetical protein